MAKCYQYTADGYFAGETEDYGLLPNNSTRTAPTIVEGKIPRWTGKKWEQVEDHKGKSGYVNGQPHEIKEYGPLPKGWSDTPPEPTPEEARTRMVAIDAEIRELEQKALRPMSAIQLGTDEPYDHERRDEIMAQIIDLRCERQMLEA
ncbi:MAG: hypothetical protein KH208_14730, partial [Desulfovibrio sp.]|nr:hypothetical protein [Desulfovibrio sp.]